MRVDVTLLQAAFYAVVVHADDALAGALAEVRCVGFHGVGKEGVDGHDLGLVVGCARVCVECLGIVLDNIFNYLTI